MIPSKEETPRRRPQLGTYYLETGYGIRPSKVDRMHSALTEYDLTKVNLQELFEGFDFSCTVRHHPGAEQELRDFILRCLREAKEMGLTVSRRQSSSSLWTWEEARDYCTQCLPLRTCCLASEPYHLRERREENYAKGDWKDGVPLQPSLRAAGRVFQHFIDRYPSMKCIARHVQCTFRQREQPESLQAW